jgi:transcriptional regulator with XRE-family HTH domain
MISKTRVTQETTRRLRSQATRTGEEVRRLRLDAGVSLRELSAVTGIHPSHLARIEAADVRPSLEVLTKIGVALGADLSIRYFAGTGPRLHDRFQAPMIEALLRVLDPRWVPTPEVRVVQPARGVIDLVLDDLSSPTTIASESQSEIRRLEQQVRWSAEKSDGLASRLAADG